MHDLIARKKVLSPVGRVTAAAVIALNFANLFSATTALAAESPPNVVASILPLQSLAAGVMEGVGRPALLIPGPSSPHTFSLRPSNAAALAKAEFVIWIGDDYETGLAKPIRNLAKTAGLLTLADAPELVRYPYRTIGNGSAARGGDADHAGIDPHLWLDPENGQRIVVLIATHLSAIDPANAGRYRANADRMKKRLKKLDREIDTTLKQVKGRPFVVVHDAYQYFERRYGLIRLSAIMIEPERSPGAKRLRQIREQIRANNIACVFAEPQFPKAIAAVAAEGLARLDVLDPLGSDLKTGADAYPELLRRLSRAIAGCLGG